MLVRGRSGCVVILVVIFAEESVMQEVWLGAF
jgi:hypothetical protein